jgi:hypothetical protein
MRIEVIEELPVAQVVVAGHRIAVASDGTLLHDLASMPALPRIRLAAPPGGLRLSDKQSLQELAAARTIPRPLLSRVTQIALVRGRGLTVQLQDGPAVYLGDASRLPAKWAAAVAVLDDPGSAGAAYVDVTDPGRPAAGALAQSSSSTADSSTGQ